jgi:uracil-DNA glycosylase
MGSYAKSKSELIDKNKHKIFNTVHPSPLSAHRGFFGCNVFKEINEYLKLKINW